MKLNGFVVEYWCGIFDRDEITALKVIWKIYIIRSKHFGQDDRSLWGWPFDNMDYNIIISLKEGEQWIFKWSNSPVITSLQGN